MAKKRSIWDILPISRELRYTPEEEAQLEANDLSLKKARLENDQLKNTPQITGDQLQALFSLKDGGERQNPVLDGLFQGKSFPVSKASSYLDLYNKATADDRQAAREQRANEEWNRRFEEMSKRQQKQAQETEDRKAQKALSGEAAKIQSIASTMVPEISQLKAAFLQDYKGALRGITLGTNRKLVKLVDNVADKVGRLRSGGAINKDEEKRFIRQIAGLGDYFFGSPEEAIAALDGILAEATTVGKNIRPNAQTQTGGMAGKTSRGVGFKVVP